MERLELTLLRSGNSLSTSVALGCFSDRTLLPSDIISSAMVIAVLFIELDVSEAAMTLLPHESL